MGTVAGGVKLFSCAHDCCGDPSMDLAWYDVVGTLGVLLILIAYGGLQFGWMRPEIFAYSVINGLGAALILISLIFEFNFSAFLIESVWLVISIYGMAKALRRGASGSREI